MIAYFATNGDILIKHKPKIAILATGGTISGVIEYHKNITKSSTNFYKIGVLSIKDLLDSAPQITQMAEIASARQIANIDSADMSDKIWLEIARCCDDLRTQVDGIIVTHGTDTMEETAIFLHCVLYNVLGSVPVILTGSMRPANAKNSDGVQNLCDAMSVAINKSVRGMGVMVVMGGKIFSAIGVEKTHTRHIDAFSGGYLGSIKKGVVSLKKITSKPKLHNLAWIPRISNITHLPKVDILHTYANDGLSVASKALFENGTKGIIIAASGAGSIHKTHKETLKILLKKGLKVAVSSRVKAGGVILSDADKKCGFISANNLNPQKARVVLMLALIKTNDNAKIAKIFDEC